jgi:glutamate dehydrogenase
MSGDVFGNGMLLSQHIKLVAAFDHRHIFIDPNPNPRVASSERRRLYETRGSTWADYDPALLSTGGGIFSRKAKSIPLTPDMRQSLSLPTEFTRTSLTPDELIRAITHSRCAHESSKTTTALDNCSVHETTGIRG